MSFSEVRRKHCYCQNHLHRRKVTINIL